MISVVRLWNTLMESAKTGTAGYQDATSFNNDLAAVQTNAMGILAPMYAANTYVQELLNPFVKSVAISVTKPTECFYFLGATLNGVAAFPISPVQAPLYSSSPIRNPVTTSDTSQKTAFYYLTASAINYIHSGSLTGTMQYLRAPLAATIVLTPVSTPERDYVTPTADVDLEWNENAFNLILALMQQRLGLELKESLLLEYAAMGIQFETQKA